MAKRSASIELQDVPLNTRFRKFTGGARDKVRERAKLDVVKVAENRFGVTVRRGIVSVKKGTVEGKGLTAAAVKAAVRRAIKTGDYDTALFDDYDRIIAEKKAKKG